MASYRIRTIKPSFWSDEKLTRLSDQDRLVFIALWNMADDDGRLLDQSRVIDAFVWPEDDRRTAVESLERLASMGRIARYCVDGQRLIQIANWRKHQWLSHPRKSTYPPPEECRKASGLSPEILRHDVEVEVEEEKDVVVKVEGRDAAAGGRVGLERPTATPATRTNGTHPEPEIAMPPRPPSVPDPVAVEPAPNGPEPYLDERRAAAAWVKANPVAFAELQRRVAAENPDSEAAGGRKAFLSALLLGRVTRILKGHDQAPTVAP